MYSKNSFLQRAADCFGEFRYYCDRTHPHHRRLTDIQLLFWGLVSVWQLFALAVRWKLSHRTAPAFVKAIGGSSYGAGVYAKEIRELMSRLLVALGIMYAIIALHFCRSKRLDFHVLALNFDSDGRVLVRKLRIFRKAFRASMRSLVARMNAQRLKEGRNTIANYTPKGRVFFAERAPEPALEIITPTPTLQALQTSPAPEKKPEPIPQSPEIAPQPEAMSVQKILEEHTLMARKARATPAQSEKKEPEAPDKKQQLSYLMSLFHALLAWLHRDPDPEDEDDELWQYYAREKGYDRANFSITAHELAPRLRQEVLRLSPNIDEQDLMMEVIALAQLHEEERSRERANRGLDYC